MAKTPSLKASTVLSVTCWTGPCPHPLRCQASVASSARITA